jgi:hypothetical protein
MVLPFGRVERIFFSSGDGRCGRGKDNLAMRPGPAGEIGAVSGSAEAKNGKISQILL